MADPSRVCENCRSPLQALEDVCPRCLLAAAMVGPSTETIRMDSDYAVDETVADRYKIVRMLGSGGMGTVYLAEDRALGHPVALKVIRPEHAGPEIAERFQREGEILAKLNHPNIARFLASGTTGDGLPFLAMEFVDGIPIDDYCDQKMIEVEERFALFQPLCSAVQHLHLQGIVHRDLKPSNILVTSEGVIKLLDFGIAKEVQPVAQSLTRSGLRLMTPEYASPEQVRAEAVTPLSDVYALGVVLYELVTGHRPYRLQSRILHEIMRAICEDLPEVPSLAVTRTETQPNGREITPAEVSRLRRTSPERLKKSLTGEVDAILLKAMAKDPRDRYWSADQFASDLRAHLERRPLLVEPGANRWDRVVLPMVQRNAWVLLASVAAAGLLGTGSIQISEKGIVILAGLGGLGLVWRLVTHPAIARRIGNSPLAGLLSLHHVGLALIVLGIVAAGSVGFMEGRDYAMSGEKIRRDLSWPYVVFVQWGDWLMFGGFVLMLATAFTNIGRLRWAGQAMASFNTPGASRRLGGVFGAIAAVGGVFSLLHQFEWSTMMVSILGGLLFLWSSRHAGKLEIRERGIVSHGVVWPWRDVVDFSVESSDWDSDYSVLRIEVRRAFGFLPTVRHELHQSQIVEAKRLLRAMLSPWPGATIG